MGVFDKILGHDDDKDKPKADFSDVRSNTAPTATPSSTMGAGASPAAPRADFSDVQSASSSAPVEQQRTYTVVAGDSLSKIAKREYGDAAKWRGIWDANRDSIKNPDLIHPGQVLNLPADL